MENKRISCKGNAADIPVCEYNSAWFCKHPRCKSIVLTGTMYGVRPSGCLKIDAWNRRWDRVRKETLLQKIITWVLKNIGLLETREVSKEEMCKSAVESGVCQRECDICAWRV